MAIGIKDAFKPSGLLVVELLEGWLLLSFDPLLLLLDIILLKNQ